MNLPIPCGLSTRFFSIVLFLIGFGFAQAQLTLPKTLDDPGRLPEITYTIGDRDNDDSIDVDYDESAGVYFEGECIESSQTLLLVGGGSQSSAGYYRIEFSGATTGVLEGSDTAIAISQTGTTTVTFTPLVNSIPYTEDVECVRKAYAYDFSKLFLKAQISFSDVRKTSYGHTGTPITFSSEEVSAARGTVLAIVQTEDGSRQSFTVGDNADAAALAAALSTASEALSIYTHGEPQDGGSLQVYGSEDFQITEGQAPTISSFLIGGNIVINEANNAEWSTEFSEDMVLPTVAAFLPTKALRVGANTNIVTEESGELVSIRYGQTDGQEDRTILVFEIEVEADHESYQIRMQYGDTGHDNSGLTDLAGNPFMGSNGFNGFVDTRNLSLAALSKQGFSVYPNPAQQLLHIDSPQARAVTYTVYDLGGKRLLTDHQSGTAHRINVSDLSKGVYLLTAKLGNQNLVHRFVKE